MSSSRLYEPRKTGCCSILFFGTFMAFPLFFAWSMFFTDANFSGSATAAALVLSTFFIIGLAGVIYGIRVLLGKSTSRAAKTLNQAIPGAALPPAGTLGPMANGYYRLKPQTSHSGMFFMLLFAAIFWNGITWAVIWSMWYGDADDAPLWFMLIFMVVGLLLVGLAIKSFFRWIMVGETHLDVNAPTAVPGQIIELLVSQPGKYSIDRLTVDFVCEEKARYRAGTDTRTKTDIVREAQVCDHTSLAAREGKVLTHQSAVVPADAVLSFKSSNNEITWFVRVKMVLPGRPDVEQLYPIRVVSPEILSLERGHND